MRATTDDVKHHNWIENIRYDTRKNNIADAKRNGTNFTPAIMKKISQIKTGLTDQDVLQIRRRFALRKRGQRLHERLAEEFGVSQHRIYDIGNGTSPLLYDLTA